jgi:hypothetical protein
MSFGQSECPVCHIIFDKQVPHQVYDRFACSRKASRSRWKARSKSGEPLIETPAHIVSTVGPTDDILAFHARQFILEPKTKPIVFSGDFNRKWSPPEGVMFVEDVNGGMIMGHEEAFK